LGSNFDFVPFYSYLCINVKVLPKNVFDWAIIRAAQSKTPLLSTGKILLFGEKEIQLENHLIEF
jgi:hypothetical protein